MHKPKIVIDLKALEDNYRRIRAFLPSDVTILCVVKSNAYGHGAKEIAKTLEGVGAFYFGVSNLKEGRELREWGIKTPILVFSGAMPWDSFETFSQFDLVPVIHNFFMFERLIKEIKSRPFRIHMKIDTGMGRLGFFLDQIPRLIYSLKKEEGIEIEGIMSHFSSGEIRNEFGLQQIRSFRQALELFKKEGIEPKFIHMANSAAVVNYPEAYFNMVRLGVALYGYFPRKELEEKLLLRKVMSVRSKVAFVKEFPKGYGLSYGRTFVTKRETKIAFIPTGYGDGYPRCLSNRSHVVIKEKSFPVVGTISMDFILVDITGTEIQEGEDVVLFGEGLDAYHIASAMGSIPYEFLCGISRGNERIYET